MMHYFCALNTLQYKKKIALLEPLLGYMQAQVNMFWIISALKALY
jgi:DCC-interacting protein 13 alpha